MPFWSSSYSWVEFVATMLASFLGVGAAIAVAMWQVRRQENLSAKEMRDQMTVAAARELTLATVALNAGLEEAWRRLGLPAAAAALDRYLASITANGPVLHHVGLTVLAIETRADANQFLRAWRLVETTIGEPLHRQSAEAVDEAAEFSHEWLLGHSRKLLRPAPTKTVSESWLRDAPIWDDWVECVETALKELSEQTLSGPSRKDRSPEAATLSYWKARAVLTAEKWNNLPATDIVLS